MNPSYSVITSITATSSPFTLKFTAVKPTAVPLVFIVVKDLLIIVRRSSTARKEIINFDWRKKYGNVYRLLATTRNVIIVLERKHSLTFNFSVGL